MERERAIRAIIAFGQTKCLPLSAIDFRHMSDNQLIGEANLIEQHNGWSNEMESLAQQLAGPEARALPRLQDV
jgi:hypothetical protein